MPDRKNVMSWLEGLAQPDWHMFHSDSEVQNIAIEALELMKEKEPVRDSYGNKRCGNCGKKLQSISDPDLFCCKCGTAVKWE